MDIYPTHIGTMVG
jgi:E3 ubiquitin-protein ligase TRIP12